MGNYPKNKGRNSKQSFVMLRHDILKSAAWQDLNTNARCVWIEIMRRYNGTNNGEIPLSCREAAEFCNISKATASRAFKELEKKGFIKIAVFAGFKNKHRVSNRWIVTHENNGSEKPSNEWRNWQPKI